MLRILTVVIFLTMMSKNRSQSLSTTPNILDQLDRLNEVGPDTLKHNIPVSEDRFNNNRNRFGPNDRNRFDINRFDKNNFGDRNRINEYDPSRPDYYRPINDERTTIPYDRYANYFDDRRFGSKRYDRYNVRRVGPVPNFQAESYVDDDIAFKVIHDENLRKRNPNEKLAAKKYNFKQTATEQGNVNLKALRYVDEHNDHLKLTPNEERVNLFYKNNLALAPPELRKPGDAFPHLHDYVKRLNLVNFKTMIGGMITSHRYIEKYGDEEPYFYVDEYYNENTNNP